jgi:hypothetical protein
MKPMRWLLPLLLLVGLASPPAQAQNGANDTACSASRILGCFRAPVLAAPPTLTGAVDWVSQTVYGGFRVGIEDGAGHDVSTAYPLPVGVGQRALTLVPLDVASVTTGGTAVTVLTAGHRTAGGWLLNPSGAAADMCINEIGTATGTTSSGSTTCIPAGRTYNLAPSALPVSVIASDSAHPISGMGFQ